MRISLLVAVALLFGSVLAIPTPMEPENTPPSGGGKGKEKQGSVTPPEGGSPSSDDSHPSQSSDSTDAGFGFIGGDKKGFGAVKTLHVHPQYKDGPRPGKSERKANNLDATHPGVVWGEDGSNPNNVMISPISHNFRNNPGIHNPQPAASYGIQGPKVGNSLIHTGPPFSTAKGNVKILDPTHPDAMSMHQSDRNRLIRDAAASAGGSGSGRRSPTRSSTAPGSLGGQPGPQPGGSQQQAAGRSRSRSPIGGGAPRTPRRQQTYAGSTAHTRAGGSQNAIPPRRSNSRSRSPSPRRD